MKVNCEKTLRSRRFWLKSEKGYSPWARFVKQVCLEKTSLGILRHPMPEYATESSKSLRASVTLTRPF